MSYKPKKYSTLIYHIPLLAILIAFGVLDILKITSASGTLNSRYALSALGLLILICVGNMISVNNEYSRKKIILNDDYVSFNSFRISRYKKNNYKLIDAAVKYENIESITPVIYPLIGLYKIKIKAKGFYSTIKVNALFESYLDLVFQLCDRVSNANNDAIVSQKLIDYLKVNSSKGENKAPKKLLITVTSLLLAAAIIVGLIFGGFRIGLFNSIQYKLAYQAETNSEYFKALKYYNNIYNYKDSKEKIFEIWNSKINPGRKTVSGDLLNTVVIDENGKIHIYGEKFNFNLDISHIDDAVEVSSTENELVILRSNAKVVYYGEKKTSYPDEYDTSSWKNIVSVAVSNNEVLGVTYEGKVLNAGNVYDLSSWEDISAVAVGINHDVGLKKDGTVIAAGDNTFGQCNVDSWESIIQISAGDGHTVGLKKDGTVVATGHNDSGQCNVESWKNIIAISASGLYTVGLTSDGKVLSTGDNFYGQCNTSDFENIVKVFSCNSHTVGVKDDNSYVTTGLNDNSQCEILN